VKQISLQLHYWIYSFKLYFYVTERVKNEHEKFLLSFDNPKLMNIPREKIMRWHPEFNVESCKKIEQAELPQLPQIEKSTAKDVLGKNYDVELH